jgi:Tol biopolymer transport system component
MKRAVQLLAVLCVVAIWIEGAWSQSDPIRQLAAGPGPGYAARPVVSANGLVVTFVSPADLTGGNPDHSVELYVVNADGTGLRQLTTGPGVYWCGTACPSISADGSVVAFHSSEDLTGGNPDHAPEIFVINSDGTGLRQLTSADSYVDPWNWSTEASITADGSQVVFCSAADLTGSNPDHFPELYVAASDGTSLRQITTGAGAKHWAGVTCSADGSVIAFNSRQDPTGANPDGSLELFVVRGDGTGLEQLTSSSPSNPGNSYSGIPSISADGTHIAFCSNQDLTGVNADGGEEIFVIHSDGTGLRQVTDSVGWETFPRMNGGSLTPDGAAVAFVSSADLTVSNPDHSYEVFVVNTDGTDLRQLTHSTDPLACSACPSIAADPPEVAFFTASGIFLALLTANQPPVVDPGPGQVIEATGGTTSFTLDGTASSDPDGDALTYDWTDVDGNPVGSGATVSSSGALGSYTFTLTVTDPGGMESSDTVTITIRDTTPPTLTPPADTQVDEGGPDGTTVALGQPTVSDICDPNPVVTNNAPAKFPLGATTVTWTATDASGNAATAQQKVTVVPGSPANQLVNLRMFIVLRVASGQVADELESGLLAKVDAAIAALARGNANDAKAAMGELKALVNQVEAQTDKKIEPATAAEIIRRANQVIAALSG